MIWHIVVYLVPRYRHTAWLLSIDKLFDIIKHGCMAMYSSLKYSWIIFWDYNRVTKTTILLVLVCDFVQT